MGIPVEDDDYVSGCARCFPANQSPRYIYATITGVVPGTYYQASDGAMPNGHYRLEHNVNCHWQADYGDVHFNLTFASGVTNFTAYRSGVGSLFSGYRYYECAVNFQNAWTDPDSYDFVYGQASITWARPAQSASFLVPADKMGIPLVSGTFCELFPVSELRSVYRFANKARRINKKISVDITL